MSEYYLVSHERYTLPQPSARDNLLAVYGLEAVARSLARTNPDGSKGVKLRKLYKNHIVDLPGKHQVSQAKPVNPEILNPLVATNPNTIRALDPELLKQALHFDKSPPTGISGFNHVDLAISDNQTLMRDEGEEERKGKRKKKGGLPDPKRPHYG